MITSILIIIIIIIVIIMDTSRPRKAVDQEFVYLVFGLDGRIWSVSSAQLGWAGLGSDGRSDGRLGSAQLGSKELQGNVKNFKNEQQIQIKTFN